MLRPLPIWRFPIGGTDLGDFVDGWLSRWLPGPRDTVVIDLAFGSKLHIPPGYRDIAWYRSGVLEPKTTETFARTLRPGAVVMDVGAHLGYYTLLASKLVGTAGKVYAFEPDPVHFAWLKRNVEANLCENVDLMQIAVGREHGKVRFFSQPTSSGGSLYRTRPTALTREIDVEVISLDEFVRARNCQRVDLVKLDVEGGEAAALEGMREVVQHNPGLRCIVEFELRGMKAAGVRPIDLVETIKRLGFDQIRALIDQDPCGLRLPEGLPRLVRMARRELYVNLLCERGAG